MDKGIHIGLAAWLFHRCDGIGFLAWPREPKPLRLSRLEQASTSLDMARIAEFARLVNFVAKPGEAARPYDPVPLWNAHSKLLSSMIFAQRAWTDEENENYVAARALLYNENGKTKLYQLYLTYRDAYKEAHNSSVTSNDPALKTIYLDWVEKGGLIQIEAAIATIVRLTTRSSLLAAQAELGRLALLSVDPAGASYAMTGFSPISVLDDSGWVKASVGLADLDGCVELTHQQERLEWSNWRWGRTGTLSFRYAILSIDRDWFSPQIYQGDDWRLSEQELVSDGNGGGKLPAFPVRLYVVRDCEFRPNPPKHPLPKNANPQIRQPLATSIVPTATILSTGAMPRPFEPTSAISPVMPRLPLSALPVRRLDVGHIERVPIWVINRRLRVAQDLINATTPNDVPSHDSTIWAVGFGCESLPKSPNPHAGYGWI